MHAKIFIALLFFAVQVEGSSLHLTNWAGRYPSSSDKGFRNVFEVPEVKKALDKLLTRSERKLLTRTYAVVTPIQLIQGHLVVQCCKPHCCPCEHAMLVVDLQREAFHVGFYEGYEGKTIIKWVSSEGEFLDLPKDIRDEFYHGHRA